MITHKDVKEYLLQKPESWLDYPFGDQVAVYKFGEKESASMFALVNEEKTPVQISLRCDPVLAEELRSEYETVLPGHNLYKKHWNTIICSGQLSDQQVYDLIDLSYRLVSEG